MARLPAFAALLMGLASCIGAAEPPPAGDNSACHPSPPPAVRSPRENLWRSLSDGETLDVLSWVCKQPMFKQSNSTRPLVPPPFPFTNGTNPFLNGTNPLGNGAIPILNITDLPCEYRLGLVTFLAPNKSEAVAYLDGKATRPPRYAQVPVFVQRTRGIGTKTYAVGPLPVSNQTVMQPLYVFTRSEDEESTSTPPTGFFGPTGFDAVMEDTVAEMDDIISDLLGIPRPTKQTILMQISGVPAKVGGNPFPKIPRPFLNDSLRHVIPYRSSSFDEGGRDVFWTEFLANPDDYDTGLMLPMGFFLKFDTTGNTTSFQGILYNGIMYKDVASFRKAWSSPGFEKTSQMRAGPWVTGDKTGPELPLDNRPPPVQVNPQARYAVDIENQYVEWMDFAFFMGVTQSGGVSLHEIRYKGERIIYELGLQEALAHYAGNDPVQAQTVYLDAAMGLGGGMFPLLKGYDCPATATYLNASSDDWTYDNICIFERDPGYPLARHRGMDYVNVIRNNILTVRFMSTLGNYDYMFDYSFYQDGSIEVTARASGNIEGAYYAQNNEYGYRIHDAFSGSMHDHVINFKLDLDINGTANTLERVDIKAVTAKYNWSPEPQNTMKLEKTFIENEDQGKINWSPNSESMYVVVNKEAKNKWGELRGYRIAPGVGSPVHLAIKNSSSAKQTANYATHHLFVTKQKDTEPRSSVAANLMDPDDPMVNFNKFFDGESLDQQDLVIWFNLGMHHVPHSGDLPYTIFTTAQSSMMISPHNYLNSSPAVQSNQAIKVKVDVVYDPQTFEFTSGKSNITWNGGESLTCALDMARFQPSYENYM